MELRLGPEIRPPLVVAQIFQPVGDIEDGAGAVVAPAVPESGVAGRVPLGEGGFDTDGVDILHDDVSRGGVLREIVVLAVEHDGGGVVGVHAVKDGLGGERG